MAEPLKLVVGFFNYEDMRALEEGIEEHNARVDANSLAGGRKFSIIAAGQDAQRVFDDAVSLAADVVLLSPDISGYRHALLRDLLLNPAKPIPVIGLVLARSDAGRVMETNGAAGSVALPLDQHGVSRALTLAVDAMEKALRDRAEGRIALGTSVMPASNQTAWQQKMITVYVPKGGGSTRTTLAVNLAVALSHASLCNVPTALVDLDMAKGDCHTLLGFTSDTDVAIRNGWPLVDRGLFEMVINATAQWAKMGEGAVNPVLIRQFLSHWGGGESQLDLLPGLMSPHQASAPEFTNWDMLYRISRKLLQELRRMYAFVVADIGQDYNLPLHRAAIDEADEVLVTVPPNRAAIVDTVHALPALRHQFGKLTKFKLVVTAYDPSFGISEREIVEAIGLPKLATIPFDALVANLSANTATPFVLTDREGPLGSSITSLASTFYPDLLRRRRKSKGSPLGIFRRMIVHEA